jgi:glycerol kinase
MMAGLGAGVWPDVETLSRIRNIERLFIPETTAKDRKSRIKIWKRAVKRAQHWIS